MIDRSLDGLASLQGMEEWWEIILVKVKILLRQDRTYFNGHLK